MKVFAIGDVHLAGGSDKPMDVFGAGWDRHVERLTQAWRASVGPEDLVLIPGDISWAMQLVDALPDLHMLGGLPGRKVLLRGNHDYWWNSLTQVRAALPDGMYALQNDALRFGGVTIAGSRGWVCPGSSLFDAARDQKLYEREVLRLGLSLDRAKPDGSLLIGMLHYPPFNERRADSGFTALFERYGTKQVVYGHLHDKACKNAFEGERNGVQYTLCSADHLAFMPKLIAEV